MSSTAAGPVEKDDEQRRGSGGRRRGAENQRHDLREGLGVHSYSSISFDLGGHCSRFLAFVGVDDEVNGNAGSVQFEVRSGSADAGADAGASLYTSSGVAGNGAAVPVSIDVTGVTTLTLIVNKETAASTTTMPTGAMPRCFAQRHRVTSLTRPHD